MANTLRTELASGTTVLHDRYDIHEKVCSVFRLPICIAVISNAAQYWHATIVHDEGREVPEDRPLRAVVGVRRHSGAVYVCGGMLYLHMRYVFR